MSAVFGVESEYVPAENPICSCKEELRNKDSVELRDCKRKNCLGVAEIDLGFNVLLPNAVVWCGKIHMQHGATL